MYFRKIMLEVVSSAEVSHEMDAISIFVEACIESMDSIAKESFDQV
jgi:hypothetical protein